MGPCIPSAMTKSLTTEIPAAPGTYVLVFRVPRPVDVRVGKLGTFQLARGFYCYVGSALGPSDLRARIRRHLRDDAPLRWHVDYLRRAASPIEVWFSASRRRLEHVWARVREADRHCSGCPQIRSVGLPLPDAPLLRAHSPSSSRNRGDDQSLVVVAGDPAGTRSSD